MAKTCGGCGRFISVTDAARCQQCSALFHRRCVALPNTGVIASTWHCPDCKKNRAAENKEVSPVNGAPSVGDGRRNTAGLSNSETKSPIPNDFPNISKSTYVDAPETVRNLTIDISTELKVFRDNLRLINQDLQFFRNEIADIRTSLDASNRNIDRLAVRVTALEKRQSLSQGSASDDIVLLKQELNDRDQQLLGNDVEITNLPEIVGENPTHTLLQIGVKLGVNLEERDIVSAERVGPRHIVSTDASGPERRPRPLAVRLARRDLRDELLSSARARRGATSADLGISGAPRRFYINERLTKANRQLFRRAREVGLQNGYRFVWCKRGRILMPNKPGDKTHCVRSEADLEHIFLHTD